MLVGLLATFGYYEDIATSYVYCRPTALKSSGGFLRILYGVFTPGSPELRAYAMAKIICMELGQTEFNLYFHSED
jgi:hypothetical protein